MLAPRVLLGGLGGEARALLGAHPHERVVGAGIVGQPLLLEVEDAADGAVQEAPVVADDDDGVGVAREVALEPERALEVEVVGRLVEQQQVGLREEHARERDAHPPAARIGRAGARLLVNFESQPLEDAGCARLAGPGVDVLQPGLHLGDAMRVGRGLGLGHERRALRVGVEHGLQHGRLRGRHLLRHAADAGALRQHDLARVGGQLAPDQAEKRGLAGAVAPHQTDLVPGRDRRRRPVEQHAPRDGVVELGDLQHGAALARPAGGVNRRFPRAPRAARGAPDAASHGDRPWPSNAPSRSSSPTRRGAT